MAREQPPAAREAQAAAAAPGPQEAIELPDDQVLPLEPSLGGGLFAPVHDATASGEGIRRLADPPSAGRTLGQSRAPPLPELLLLCPQALPIGAVPAPAAPYREPLRRTTPQRRTS